VAAAAVSSAVESTDENSRQQGLLAAFFIATRLWAGIIVTKRQTGKNIVVA
jgi:hypothetical protein